MHVLVTGGAGFIGSNVVEYHLARGDKVCAIDDLSTGSLQNIAAFKNNANFRFEEGNVLTYPDLDKLAIWSDRIYHLAATIGMFRVLSEPITVITNNVMTCDRIFHAAVQKKDPPKVIFSSSSSVYSASREKVQSENSEIILTSVSNPLYNYAVSKVTGEALAHAYYKVHNLPVVTVRIFNTIGPRQTGKYGMVVPRFVRQACNGEPLTVFGDGTQTRSFCDVRDLITMFDRLFETPKAMGEIINVGNPQEVHINDLATLVKARAKSTSSISHIPYSEAYGEELVEIKVRRPDIRKLLSLIDFEHAWSLENTVDDLIARYRAS